MNEEDIVQQLRDAVNAGDANAYYGILNDNGMRYGNLARDAANNEGFFGRFANNFLDNKAEEREVPYTPEIRDQIMQDLMRADFDGRLEQGVNGVAAEDIKDYHHEVFNDYGLPPEAWTGTVFDDRLGPAAWLFDGNIVELEGVDGSDPNAVIEDILNNLHRNLSNDPRGTAHDAADFLQDAIVGDGGTPILDGVFADTLQDLVGASVDDLLDGITGGLIDGLEGLKDIYDDIGDDIGDAIEDVRDLFEQAMGVFIPQRNVDPLVLDLDGDGLEISSLQDSTINFDLDANGFAETTAWVSGDDGFLVMDRNGNGSIDNGAELFGNHTLTSSGVAAEGFSALTDIDSNGDGLIDVNDTQYVELGIWQDINQDGKSDASEISSLSDMGIASISLSTSISEENINGNSVAIISTFTRQDGVQGEIGDVLLQVDPLNSEFVGDYRLSLDALKLPLARGYGNVVDLHIGASENTDLTTRLQHFVNSDIHESTANLSSLVEEIIFEWAGTTDIDPDSRGTLFDARKLEALEAFLAADFENTMGNGSPMMENVSDLNNAWDSLVTNTLATLAVQSFGRDIYPSATYSFNTDTISYNQDIDAVVAELKANQPQDSSSAAAYWINNYRILSASASSFTTDVGTAISGALAGTPLEVIADKLGYEHIGGSSAGDTLYSSSTSYSIVTAGAGDDTLTGSSLHDVLYGGEGNDTLHGGTSGFDVLDGGAGDDTITYAATNRGYSGTITGGAGNDAITGGRHTNDVYHFGLGDGQDVISDNSAGSYYGGRYSNADRIILGGGIATSDVTVTRDSTDLIIKVGTNGDQITISQWYDSTDNRIEFLEFPDGSEWAAETLDTLGRAVYGTAGDDVMVGLAGLNELHGEGGNDTLTGNSSNDILYGGDGNDTLTGGTLGNDVFYGGAGDDTIIFSASSKYSSGTITGGTGNDSITGGRYTNDVYHFGLGDGQDVISEGSEGSYYRGRYSSADRIILGSGIATSDVTVTRDNTDLIIKVGANGDQITISQWYDSTDNRIEFLEFADGSEWAAETLDTLGRAVYGTAGDDVMVGLAGSNELHGEGGNDTLTGTGGHDTLYGGEGNDTLSGGGGGNDVLDGGAGDDIITYVGNSSSYSGSITGGAGNDSITGGSRSNDTYHFGLGDGQDVISDNSAGSYYGGGRYSSADRIVLGSGIATSDVTVTRDSTDLIIKVGTNGDQITINQWYDSWENNIEFLEFSDGTEWTAATLDTLGRAVYGTAGDDVMVGLAGLNELHGEGGNDTLTGTGGHDTLYGGEGNDTLNGGGGGNDVLDGGAGDDTINYVGNSSSYSGTITGGAGNDSITGGSRSNDTYHFGLGDGQDVISDNSAGSYYGGGQYSNADRIILDGINHEELWFSQNGNDLLIEHTNTDDQIAIKDWYSSSYNQVETIQAGTEALLSNSVNQLVQAMASISAGEPGNIDDLTTQQQDNLSSAIAAAWQTS